MLWQCCRSDLNVDFCHTNLANLMPFLYTYVRMCHIPYFMFYDSTGHNQYIRTILIFSHFWGIKLPQNSSFTIHAYLEKWESGKIYEKCMHNTYITFQNFISHISYVLEKKKRKTAFSRRIQYANSLQNMLSFPTRCFNNKFMDIHVRTWTIQYTYRL